VARFLEERGGLSGQQLVAAGFSSYRPVTQDAAGATAEKNRRVEIVLLAGK
jgi:flagellar motor protein MotB